MNIFLKLVYFCIFAALRNGAIVKSILDMGFQMKDIIYAANEYTKDKGSQIII